MKKIGIGLSMLLLLIFISASSFAADFRLGTGGEKGIYHSVAGKNMLQQTHGSRVAVSLVPGNGSLDNINKIKGGELDGAFVQPDALLKVSGFDFEMVKQFHPEYAHLIVLKDSPIKSIKDLNDKTVIAVGKNGGGSSVTWDNFGVQDKKYEKIPTVPKAGAIALSGLESGEITAIFRVCGLRDGEIMRINQQPGKFKLIPVDDWDLNDKVQGKDIYEFVDIDDDVYPNLFPGAFNGSIKTIMMKTVMIANTSWIEENGEAYEDLYDSAARAVPNILKAVQND